MPIDPYLQSLLDQIQEIPSDADWDSYRQRANREGDELFAEVGEPGPEVGDRRDMTIPVADGEVDAFVYWPFTPGPRPVHLFLHGGAFSMGSIRMAVIDATCRERCISAESVVVSLEYRKSPEYRFPTALNDCYAALQWVADNAKALGVRPDIITVGGQSAGGNLAAALTLKARDEGGPPIAFQLLEIPVLDLTLGQPSVSEFATGYGLTLRSLEIMRQNYLSAAADATSQYASPLLAPDLSRLPPAHIMTAEYDPLRDEGAGYARRLREAGVPVTYSILTGHIHGSGAFTRVMASARAWRDEALAALRNASTPNLISSVGTSG